MRHHLAILYRNFLDEIVSGHKTIECRVGRMGLGPHGAVEKGDLVWFKQVSGPMRAVAAVRSVRCFWPLGPDTLEMVRREFNEEIRAPDGFWTPPPGADAATLIWLGDVCALKPFYINKKDRRAWVVLGGPPVPGQTLKGRKEGVGS